MAGGQSDVVVAMWGTSDDTKGGIEEDNMFGWDCTSTWNTFDFEIEFIGKFVQIENMFFYIIKSSLNQYIYPVYIWSYTEKEENSTESTWSTPLCLSSAYQNLQSWG